MSERIADERPVDSSVDSESPPMLHIAGFALDRNLCGIEADPLDELGWATDESTMDCVVCAETWRSMTYAQRRALNIFWGGTGGMA